MSMASEPLAVSRVSELVLEVDDLQSALHFYADALGLAVASVSDERAWLVAGGTRIGLWTAALGPGIAGGRGGRHVHFALHVDEEALDAAATRLETHGFQLEQLDSRDRDRGRAVYATDPAGNVVELWTLDVSAETEVRA